jgi:predicted PurR-regulated permease PerM
MPPWLPRAMVLFIALALGAWAGVWLVGRLRGLLVIILVSLFLSFAMEPAVNRLASIGWRRGVATGAVMAALFLVILAFLVAMGSLLVDQTRTLIDEAPGYIEDIEKWVNDTFDTDFDAEDLVKEFQEGGRLGDLAQDLGRNALSVGATVVGVLFQLLTISLFTFYLVADGPRLRRAICSVLQPERQRVVLDVWNLGIDKTGRYLYSRVILALVSTIFHGIAFAVVGVPSPVALAIWVGVTSQFIPVVGTYLAGVLPVGIALLDEPVSALWVLGLIVVYQQIENYILAPRVSAQTMDLHPAVAFGAVLVGVGVLGVVGALLALPVAAVLQAFVSSYVARHDVVPSGLTTADGGVTSSARRSRRTVDDTEADGSTDG